MPEIILVRTSYLEEGTTGQILDRAGKPICLSLERPWKDNARNISCVPTGLYEMELDVRHPGTKKAMMVWELRGVEGRSQIQFHPGNRVKNSLGCILTATTLGIAGAFEEDEKTLFGGSSRQAFSKFMSSLEHRIGEKKTHILITDRPFNFKENYGNG